MSPPAKASAWIAKMPSEKKMPSTAPSDAPEDAPRMSGETNGLRNRPWKAVPATASAAPISIAATTRGPRTCQTTVSIDGATFAGWPVSFAAKTAKRSLMETAKRPAVKASSSPATRMRAEIRRPGALERAIGENLSLPPRQHTVEIGVRRRHMIEALVEITRQRADVFLEMLGVEDLRQPPQPDQAIDRGREVDPAERQFWRQMHATVAHGGDFLPERIAPHIGREVAIDGDDNIGIPQQHLLDRDNDKPALALARDVARAEIFDGLDIDGAAESCLQPARPPGVVDARAFVFRNAVHARLNFGERILRVGS